MSKREQPIRPAELGTAPTFRSAASLLAAAQSNRDFVRTVQEYLRVEPVDGVAGPKTKAAWVSHLFNGRKDPPPSPWPAADERSLREFYGEPGDESNLTRIELPYPMRLAWDTDVVVKTTRCHRKVAESLVRCLEGVHRWAIDQQFVHALSDLGLDLYGGCFLNRKQRGGSAWSLHAWGAAIDLNPDENGLHTHWPSKATMPVEVIEIFEVEGWLSGARRWGRDAMHFQATR